MAVHPLKLRQLRHPHSQLSTRQNSVKLVQDSVKQSVPEQQAAPSPVSAQEIQSIVEAAVMAAAPVGASPEEISAMVQQAVVASAQPVVSKEDVESLVTSGVSDAAAASQPGVSATEVEKIVSEAIRAIPTAAPVRKLSRRSWL